MRLPKPMVEGRQTERMSNASFRIMVLLFDVIDFVYPHVARRAKRFGIGAGMTVVDYGCGPGRYTINFANSPSSSVRKIRSTPSISTNSPFRRSRSGWPSRT